MSLAVSFLALLTIPLFDVVGNRMVAIQIACGLGLLFTMFHIVRLLLRTRAEHISQPAVFNLAVVIVDVLVLLVAAAGVAVGSAPVYEWVLVLMLARPALAFIFVLSEVTAG